LREREKARGGLGNKTQTKRNKEKTTKEKLRAGAEISA
jgi:hypothetical protein